MLSSMLTRVRDGVLRGARAACLIAGAVLLTVAVSSIVLPFVLGLGCLVLAEWFTARRAEQASPAFVPVQAG